MVILLKQRKRRITLQDVAKHAGVSTSTASLVIRNNPRISDATRKKVLDSIEELGYVYDRVAAKLRSQSSKIIGVIVTDISNKFISEFLIGVQQTLEKMDYTVLLGTTFDSVSKQERLISTMVEHRVDGLIINPASKSNKSTISQLNHLELPVVLANREVDHANCDYVGIDYIKGTYLAVDHLLKKGHKRIAFLGGIKMSSTWKDRMKGFQEAHNKAGLEVDKSLIIDGLPTSEGGIQTVLEVLNNPNPPTAIFCFSDLVAFGVLQGLGMKGMIPGQDIDIVGFDNIPESEIYHPPLTTVSSFPRTIGIQAATILYNKLEQDDPIQQRIILNPELVIRETST